MNTVSPSAAAVKPDQHSLLQVRIGLGIDVVDLSHDLRYQGKVVTFGPGYRWPAGSRTARTAGNPSGHAPARYRRGGVRGIPMQLAKAAASAPNEDRLDPQGDAHRAREERVVELVPAGVGEVPDVLVQLGKLLVELDLVQVGRRRDACPGGPPRTPDRQGPPAEAHLLVPVARREVVEAPSLARRPMLDVAPEMTTGRPGSAYSRRNSSTLMSWTRSTVLVIRSS